MADDDLIARLGQIARGAALPIVGPSLASGKLLLDNVPWQQFGQGVRDTVNTLGPLATPLTGPLPVIGKLLRDINEPEAARVFDVPAGHLAAGVAATPAAPHGLYNLLNAGVHAAGGGSFIEGLTTPVLPGSEATINAASTISHAADQFGGGIAGEELKSGLLSDNDIPNKIGTFASIVATTLPAPASLIAKVEKGIKAVDTGMKVVDTSVKLGLRGLEAMLPFTMGAGKTAMAANVGAGAAITGGIDLLIEDYKTRLDDAQKASPKVSDLVAQGAADMTTGTRALTTATAPFQVPTPEYSDDAVRDTVLGAALAGGSVLGYIYRGGIRNLASKVSDKFDRGVTTGEANISDKLAPLDATFKAVPGWTITEDAGKGLINRYANAGSQETMLGQVKRDGTLPGFTAYKLKPLTAHEDGLRALPNQGNRSGQEVFDDRLMAMKEIQDRLTDFLSTNPSTRLQNHFLVRDPNTGVFKLNEPNFVNFMNDPKNTAALPRSGRTLEDTDTLWKNAREIFNDPAQRALYTDMQENLNKVAGYLGPKGMARWSAAEIEKVSKQNPSYFPVELDDISHLQPRSRGAGSGSDTPRSVLAEYETYFDQVLTAAWTNNARRLSWESLLERSKQGDVAAKAIVGRKMPEFNKANSKEQVRYRDYAGNEQVWTVKDPLMATALRMESPVLMRSMLDVPQQWRVLNQRLTTGGPAALMGNFFAHSVALMNTAVIMSTRPKQLVAGSVDQFLRDVVGFKPGLKFDPSFIPQIVSAVVRDAAVLSARGLAERFETSVRLNGMMSKILGPQSVQSIANAARAKYEASVMKEMLDAGIGHGAGQLNTSQYGAGQKSWLDSKKAWLLTQSPDKIQSLAQGAKAMWNFADEMNNVIAGSPVSALYRQNRGRMDGDSLNKLVREAGVDASKTPFIPQEFTGVAKGASTLHHGLMQTAPYYNITIQSLSRLAKALKDDPIGTSTGIAMAVTIPNLMAIAWNAALGPEYSEHQFNVRDNGRQASSLYLGWPDAPPEQGLEITVDSLFGAPHVLAQEAIGSFFGLQDGTLFKPENEVHRLRLVQLAGRRATENYWEAADRMLSIAPIPALAAGIPAMTGVGVNQMGPQALRHGMSGEGRGLFKQPRVNRMAGFANDPHSRLINTSVFGIEMDDRFEEVLRGALGATGQAISQQMMTLSGNLQAGNSVGAMLKDAGENLGLATGDRTRAVSGLLWQHNPKIVADGTTNKELSAKIRGAVDAQRALEEYKKYGYIGTKTRGFVPSDGANGQLPMDVESVEIAEQALAFNKTLDKHYKGPIRELYDQINKVQSSARSPVEKRNRVNEYTKQIQMKQGALLDEFNLFEHSISKQLEDKYKQRFDFSFDRFDPSKPITQFRRSQ